MATITEDYVSFEVAKLLKEKGFDVYGDGSFGSEIKIWMEYSPFGKIRDVSSSRPSIKGYPAPTLQMAMKWLREKYNLFIEIQCYGCGANEEAHFEFSFVVSEFMQFDNKICTTVGLKEKKAKSQHNTYEEAVEAACVYCLENLI